MELTKLKLKRIIKEEILNLAEFGQIGQLSADEAQQFAQLARKASEADLALVGRSREEEEKA